MLARVFGCARVVFNDALRVRDDAYRAGVKLSDSEIQRRVITAAKTTTERAWLCGVSSVALVQSVNDSRRAWRNFFDSHTGKRKGRKVGRPRFKSRKDNRQSFRLTRNGFTLDPMAGCSWPRSATCGCAGPASCPAHRRTSRSSGNRMAISTPVSSSTCRHHRCRRLLEKLGWMWGSPGWPRPPRPMARAVRCRKSEAPGPQAAQTCSRPAGESSPPERISKQTQNRGARKPSRTTRSPVPGGTITTSRLWLVRENQVVYLEDLNIAGMVNNRRLARVIPDAGGVSSCG